MRRQLIWAVLLVLASFGFASAQETTSGSITGEVVDAQGAPVPGRHGDHHLPPGQQDLRHRCAAGASSRPT